LWPQIVGKSEPFCIWNLEAIMNIKEAISIAAEAAALRVAGQIEHINATDNRGVK
jgi:hypothetical protein